MGEEQEQHLPLEKKYTFSFPASITNFTNRLEIELEPSDYLVNRVVSRIHELLGIIPDHDLVRQVCQSEEQGIFGLYRAIREGIPHYYDYAHPEVYQAFLTRLEDLAQWEMVRSMNISSPSFLYPQYHDRRAHPHSLLVYALAVGALGKEVYPLAMDALEAVRYIRIDLPEVPWVRHELNMLYSYGYRSGY